MKYPIDPIASIENEINALRREQHALIAVLARNYNKMLTEGADGSDIEVSASHAARVSAIQIRIEGMYRALKYFRA